MLFLTFLKFVKGCKMDIDIITNLINSVGFPIFTCIALFWFIKDVLTKQSDLMKKFNDSINLNTETIKLLVEQLRK